MMGLMHLGITDNYDQMIQVSYFLLKNECICYYNRELFCCLLLPKVAIWGEITEYRIPHCLLHGARYSEGYL